MSGISVYAHIRPDTAVETGLQTDKAGTYLVLSAGGLDIFIRGREKLLEITSMLERAAQEWEGERRFRGLSDDPRAWAGVYRAMIDAAPDHIAGVSNMVADAAQGEPVGYVSPRLLDALRSGKACGITLEDKPDAHSGVTIPLYTAPQPTEQQPELAKYQPCGCVICTCEHETQCQGCGGHHCGAHPVGQIPNPAYQQVDRQALAKIHASRAADDLHARNRLLVEALEQIERWDGFPSTGEVWEDSGEPVSYGAAFGSNGERDFMREVARAALAAHRKQGGGA